MITPLCVFGAVIGMQVLMRLGVTTNTALVGAMVAMALGRVPLASLRIYRSIHVQNLAQSAISAATFGAANSLLLPIGIPFALGRPDLVLPMFVGATLAMLLDATLLYRMFGSRVFPAEGAWPPGVAAAEAIRAGDEGGRKAWLLGIGLVVGIAGSVFGIPMSGFGVAFIGNAWALSMFALGLLGRGYVHLWSQFVPAGWTAADPSHIPQGLMLGAGLAALAQVVWTIVRGERATSTIDPAREASAGRLPVVLGGGAVTYLAIAALLAALAGFWTQMDWPLLVGFIVYAAFAALLHELIIGLAGMHSGWFPAFAVAVVSLAIGLLIGFPPPALALLVGFTAATGPAFADMGCDLKAGFLLRGQGEDMHFELEGRRQQYLAAMFALLVATIVVAVACHGYFARNTVAPVDHVFVATIRAGTDPAIARALALWAIPGAALQFLGGQKRQLGIMLATGTLLVSPLAGWAVATGLIGRALWLHRTGEAGRANCQVFAAGAIAGDALYSFGSSLVRTGK
nr:OPT/YSL family transporter [Endobacter medicaginis]